MGEWDVGEMRVELRPLRWQDWGMVIPWLQHPNTRHWSRKQRELTPAELGGRMGADNWMIYVQGHPCGVITYSDPLCHVDDWPGEVETEVSIFIAPDWYGRGVATAALKLTPVPMAAEILEGNVASETCFSRAGFIKCADQLWRRT